MNARATLPPVSRPAVAAFTWYARRLVAQRFTAIRIMRDGAPPDVRRPCILYANHASWWDPLVMVLIARALFPRQRVYAPIDDAALERYPSLARLGLFGVRADSVAGTRRFLSVGRAVLETPDAVLALTPQGRFVDVRERPVVLAGGLARLLLDTPGARAYPVALEYAFWNEMRPEILIRFGQDPVSASGTCRRVLTAGLGECLAAELDRLAAAACTREPERFAALVAGARGIGFWQDLPMRLRAWLSGRRFDGAHAAVRARSDSTHHRV
jgi:hypothetical protein